jgi:polyhydroxybutyrate depolymerase
MTGLLLALAWATLQAAPQLPSGTHELTLRHGGAQRRYLVHVPPRPRNPVPVLLAFHGGGGNAEGFQRSSELDAVADREGFVVVYPGGSGPLPRRLLTWNAGDGCCGYARTRKVNDPGFAASILGDLERRLPIDRRRVYATGHSNGGMMAHRLGAERSGLFAAIVAVGGALDLAQFAPTEPVAVLQIHSIDDPRALYAGGLGPPFPGTSHRVQHQPVMAGLERWTRANGCVQKPDTLDKRSNATGHTATLIVWRGCRSGVEVAHWKLTGSGHGWPGNVPPGGGELAGPQTTIVLAAEEVWAFVSRFAKVPEGL